MNEPRITSIDALRGIAVLLMINQHMGAWLAVKGYFDGSAGALFFYVSNLTGMIAAPLFIFISGVGIYLFSQSKKYAAKTSIKRGLFIIAAGYLANVLTPSFFAPTSWYALHCIGLLYIISPILLRMPVAALILVCTAGFAVTPAAQTFLATPINISWPLLSDTSRTGGIARLIFFEGHFPLFPWISLFVSGIIAGQFVLSDRYKTVVGAGFLLTLSGFILIKLYSTGYAFAVYGPLFRLFVNKPTTHYPPFISQIILLNGLVLIVFACAYRLIKTDSLVFLSSIGKSALSLFFFHLVLFSNMISLFKLENSLHPLYATIVSLITTLITGILVSWILRSYRGLSLEHLMRKVTG